MDVNWLYMMQFGVILNPKFKKESPKSRRHTASDLADLCPSWNLTLLAFAARASLLSDQTDFRLLHLILSAFASLASQDAVHHRPPKRPQGRSRQGGESFTSCDHHQGCCGALPRCT